MSHRTKIIEEALNLILPQDYKQFIDNIGIISDANGEVFGYIDGIDCNKIPCIVAATKLYKENYGNILVNEVVISFDDFKNTPIILNTEDESVYEVDFDKKIMLSPNFKEWLNEKTGITL